MRGWYKGCEPHTDMARKRNSLEGDVNIEKWYIRMVFAKEGIWDIYITYNI